MRAVCWWSKGEVRVVDVPDPRILNAHDVIVRVSLTAICGTDLHLYDGVVPTMMHGDVLGHEFMGEVVEIGAEVKNVSAGAHRLRTLLVLSEKTVVALRQHQSERLDDRDVHRLCDGRGLRLIAHVRRIRGRTGAVRARAVRRRQYVQGPGRGA